MEVHLIDGTSALLRDAQDDRQRRLRSGRVRSVLGSILGVIREGATHLAVATDQVIESFRNDLWHGYKSGAGIEPDLLSQFPLFEEALSALGVVVWPMVEYEADDALAAGATAAAKDRRVERVIICTPDKDLAQCVRGTHIVQLDRRKRVVRDEAAVFARFGVPPTSIPDYLAVVGDAADGFPGLAGWGAKSAATVLARVGHLEPIPKDWHAWDVQVANSRSLSATLLKNWDLALLFRNLTTLRTDLLLLTPLASFTGPERRKLSHPWPLALMHLAL